MTSTEIVKALRRCEDGECGGCLLRRDENCIEILIGSAADLIERLEKEKAALIGATIPRKLCDICKHDSWRADHRCNRNLCEECSSYSDCPCLGCLSHPKWEWKGLEDEK